MEKIRINKVGVLCVATTLGVISTNANASAFGIKEQSITNLGNAFAGTTAYAKDASTGWYNPAGLALLDSHQVGLSLAVISAKSTLDVIRATSNTSAAATGDSSTNLDNTAPVPGLHLSVKINDRFSAAFNTTIPFGLETNYNDTSKARYMATRSQIITVNNSISGSYKINDKWAFGFGIDALFAHAVLNTAVNTGTEGHKDHRGNGWGYGYHTGLIWQVSDLTKLGLAYHSKVTPRARGTVNKSAGVPGNYTEFTAKVPLPDKVVYSITHRYSDKWVALADVEYTHWSVLKVLRLDYQGAPATANDYSEDPLDYKNTWRFAFGADYEGWQNIMLKAGVAYEKSPVQDTNRTARVPDSNRIWVAFGGKYQTTNFLFDVAYAHLFFNSGDIDAIGPRPGTRLQTVRGTYKKNYADIIGLQVVYRFNTNKK